MPLAKTEYVQSFWIGHQKVVFRELNWTLKMAYNWMEIWGGMIILQLYEVSGNICDQSLFLFLLEKQILKTQAVFCIV